MRLDGKLLKRFTVGGGAKGRPAAASYAGDGEPGFAGDPEWETYMQTGGDAGLEIRLPIQAGPRTVGVSFVRELWEPEGLPQPLQRGRVLTNDQIYMDYAAVGSVQIGGPYRIDRPAVDTPSRRAIFVCKPAAGADEHACATQNPVANRAPRLPPSGHAPLTCARCSRSSTMAGVMAGASTPASSSRSSACSSIPISCCAFTAIRPAARRRRPRIA